MKELTQYIAAILLEKAHANPDEAYGGSIQSIRSQLSKEIGSNITGPDVQEAISILEPFGAAESDYSPLTGGFWTINYDNFRYYFIETASEKDDDASRYEEISKESEQFPVLRAYGRRGSRYAIDAAQQLRGASSVQWEEFRQKEELPPSYVPAANRIVTLDHNQQFAIEAASSEVIAAMESENAIDGDSSLRQRVMGQLKAGRELVRAQTLNSYLLYATVVGALNRLIENYAGHAIGEAAKKLLDLLIEQVFTN